MPPDDRARWSLRQDHVRVLTGSLSRSRRRDPDDLHCRRTMQKAPARVESGDDALATAQPLALHGCMACLSTNNRLAHTCSKKRNRSSRAGPTPERSMRSRRDAGTTSVSTSSAGGDGGSGHRTSASDCTGGVVSDTADLPAARAPHAPIANDARSCAHETEGADVAPQSPQHDSVTPDVDGSSQPADMLVLSLIHI